MSGWRSEWVVFIASAALLLGCGLNSAKNNTPLDGGAGDSGPGDSGPGDSGVSLARCEAVVRAFCDTACGCGGSQCVTRKPVPNSTGLLELGWSDHRSCVVAFTSEWCAGTARTRDIDACEAAVRGLACEAGGATQPDACEPMGPELRGEVCESDADCDGAPCIFEQSLGAGPSMLIPRTMGRCARVCGERIDGDLVCGADCQLSAGVYCPQGWNCGSVRGVVSAVCTCGLSSESSVEQCNQRDDDCNGVADDPEVTDLECQDRLGAGHGCVRGQCVECRARCDGECVDTRVSNLHCGGCDVRCEGDTTCAGSECRAFRQVVPPHLAIDALFVVDGYIYYQARQPSGMFRCPVTGCTGEPEQIGPAITGRLLGVAAGEFFFTRSPFATHEIVRCPVTGCDPEPLVVTQTLAPAQAAVVHAGVVYFALSQESALGIYACAVTGCDDAPELLTDAVDMNAVLVVDADGVYYSSSGRQAVLKCPLTGPCGDPVVIAEADHTTRLITVQGGTVYFEHGPTPSEVAIARCATSGCATPDRIVDGYAYLTTLHGDQLYFYGNREVLQCSVDACTNPTRLWAPSHSLDALRATAADSERLFLKVRHSTQDGDREVIWSLRR